MLRFILPALLVISAFAAAPLRPAMAQNLDDIVAVSVEPGWQTQSGTWIAALHFTLAPGWKTYWRAPGDAGIPPQFDWSREANIAAVSLRWPVPEIFDQAGMRSIGYHDRLVLPIEIWPAADGSLPRLAGTVDLGVCQDICVPVHLAFDGAVAPEGTGRNPVVMAALIDQPLTESEAGLRAISCQIETAERGMRVTVALTLPALGAQEAVVIETANPALWVSEAQTAREGDVLRATALVVPPRGGSMLIERSGLRFTVLADGRAVDIRGCQQRR